MRKLIFIILISFTSLLNAETQDIYSFTSKKEAKQFYNLTQQIRCVVCQNQNIADSNAPLAYDLRKKVYGMVLSNQSDDDIKTYLINRYGEFILFQPPVNKLTFLLWGFPIIGLLCFIAIGFRLKTERSS